MTRLLAAIGAVVLFWTLRSHTLNPDGEAFQAKFERTVPVAGVFITHDEILEFAIHSKFWALTHETWGWDVSRSYQVLSCVAGGLFVLLLLLYGNRVCRARGGAFTALVLTGGFVQLFFGDVENYTLTAVWILGYFVVAERALAAPPEKPGLNVVWPTVLLAGAMMFHLLAGFLLPALFYVWWRAWTFGDRRRVALAAVALVAVVGGTFVVAARAWHLPFSAFLTTHAAGHGGRYREVLARPSLAHYWTQIRLLVLLVPGCLLVVPLLAARGFSVTPRTTHLVIATICMLLFFFAWYPWLGAGDWNLFASVAIPISLLVWPAALTAADRWRHGALGLAAVGGLFALRTLTWIWMNHRG